MTIGILLLAAGTSSRYLAACGRHKLLEPLGDTTLFERTLNNLQQLALPLCVVLRPQDSELQQLAKKHRAETIIVDSRGTGESIAAGVRARPRWAGWLIMLADMPWIMPESCSAVIEALQYNVTARTFCHGQPGHPVGFRHELVASLIQLSGDSGAREILQRYPPGLVEVNDKGCCRDVDLPEMLTTGEIP